MRATRYLWISNLPVRTSEQDIRDALQSHGKIQSVRIHSAESTCNAVVAFVDTKSATRAIESTVRINKTKLSLQYCESSGVPGNTVQDPVIDSGDNLHACSSEIQKDVQLPADNRSTSGMSDSGSSTQERKKKMSSYRSETPRASLNGSGTSIASNTSTGRYDGDQRGLHIRHLPLRSSDTNLREGLFHEYKKHGKITSVVIRGQGEDRYCIITFKRPEDAERALEVSRGKVFFGTPISVSLHEGIDSEDPDLCPPEHALDEYHPKATKTLFVGNLCSSTITQDELRRTFRIYGEIIEIDIKIQANQPGTSYAFVQFSDIKSVVRALTNQENIRVSGKQVKLGFGKSQPTNVVWLDNLAPTINESFLTRQFGRYGHLTHVVLDRKSLRALLYFDTVEMAQRALNETRNRALIGRKVQLDYAGYECQVAFVRRLAKHDGFSQVYDNYRERIQEMLSMWPSYGNVLPLLERQRHLSDIDKDTSHVSSDECGRSSQSRRSSSRRAHRGDRMSLEYPLGRTRTDLTGPPHKKSQRARDQFATGLNRHNMSGKDNILENSLSPLSDTHSHSKTHNRRLHSHSARHKFSSNDSPDNQGAPPNSPPRRNSSQVRSPYCEINYRAARPSSMTSKPLRTVHANSVSHLSARQPSHYLDETDEVSSGSLSPDLEPDGSNSDTSLVEHDTHHKTRRCSGSTVSKAAASIKRRTPTGACSVKTFTSSRSESNPRESTYHHSRKTHSKAHRDSPNQIISTSKKVRPTDPTHSSSRVLYNLHTPAQSSSVRMSASPHGFINHDLVDKPLSRSPSQGAYPESKLKRPVRVSGGSYEAKADRTSRSRESHSRCSYHSDEKSSLNAQQLTTVCSESHDTLTKLELERAKLLRELSMLNSEVGGSHKNKISTKKRAPSDIPDDIYASKIKRLDPHQNSETADNSIPCPMSISGSVCNDDNRNPSTKIDNYSNHSCTNQAIASSSRSSPISRPSNDGQSSIGEPGELLSPVTTGPALSVGGSLSAYKQLTARSSTHPLEHRPPSASTSIGQCLSRRSTLITSSPRLILPPEPTSPLNRLSSPDSPEPPADVPSTTEGSAPSTSSSNQFMSPDSAPCFSRRSLQSPSSLQFGSNPPLRDPRLAAHQAHAATDIPPPPPPPPECLKLPLWVDTSQLNSHFVNRLPPPPSAPRQSSSTTTIRFDWRSGPCLESETETNSSLEAVNCSLDERIRLLDAQLLKSEKARPAVDYSKFRIRRKAESSVSAAATVTASSSPAISTPLTSTVHVSPVNELNSVYSSRVERVYVPECTPTTSVLATTQMVSYSSPRLHCPTSPLPLPRLADTSEFVKSMLSSSKPSPSNPGEHPSILPLDATPTRQLNRLPGITVSSPIPSNIPTENVGKSSLMNGAPHAPSSFATRQFGPLNTRLLPQSGTSLSGTQPIGVATRLPSVQTFNPDSTSRPSSNDGVSTSSETGYVKSILKKDVCSSTPGDSVVAKLLGPKQSLPEISPTSVQSSTELSSSGTLTTAIYKRSTIDSLDQKLEKSNESGVKTTTTTTANDAFRSTTALIAKPGRHLSSDGKKSVTSAQTATKIKTSRLEVIGSSTGASKSTKPETPRPVLDDSVFKSSLETTGNKGGKLKRNSMESRMPPSNRKGRPSIRSTKTQETSMTSKTDVHPKVGATASEPGTSTQKMTQTVKRTSEPNADNGLPERTPLFEKHKYTPLHVEKRNSTSEPQNKENKTPQTQVSSRVEGPQVSGQNKRKARESRKRLLESDGSDDENRSVDAGDIVTQLNGGYESMYDKIKRRANKDGSSEKPSEKSGILKRFFKARGKTGKRSLKRTKRSSELSPVDSDTDECLTGTSSTSDDAKNKSKGQRTKTTKSSDRPERIIQRKSTASKYKNVRMWSAMSCIKNNKPDDELVMRKGKTNRTSVSKRDRMKNKQQTPQCTSGLDSDGNSEKLKQKSFEGTKSNTKSTYGGGAHRNPNQSELKKRVNKSNTSLHSAAGSKHPTTTFNKKVKSVNKSTKSHRSLVHRVFASTDSETPSLSSSETELEDKAILSNRSEQPQSCSPSSTPRISRSCSPEDLGADAAIRHTFGAFTMPVNSATKKPGISPTVLPDASLATKCSSSPDSHLTKSLPDSAHLMSKSTPPTLPMLDSSSSADHLAEPHHLLRARDPMDWNIFSSLTSQSIPIIEPYPRASTPTAVSTTSHESMFSSQRDFRIEKSVSDLEDELPSLEKHDEDDSSKLDAGSLLLNDSTSLMNRGDTSNNAVDDDLPPPVVSAVGYLSPGLPIVEPNVEKTLIPDVIEEVVYDSLEVPVVNCEQPYEVVGAHSLKSDPSVDGTEIVLDSDVAIPAEPADQKHNISFATPIVSTCFNSVIANNVIGSSDSTIDSETWMQTKAQVLPVSSAPLSLTSTVYTPIAMLTSASQSDDFPGVTQPLFVTVPATTAGVGFASSGLALLPAALPTASVSQNKPAAQVPRHVALILPATSIPLSGSSASSAQVPTATSVFTTTTLVYNTTVANSNSVVPSIASACGSCVPTTMSSICIRGGNETSGPYIRAYASSATKPSIPMDAQLRGAVVLTTASGEPVCGDLCNTTEESMPSSGTSAVSDPPDYTSYVQRVIERVKQEKDEEVSHQREKIKRPKKVPTSLISIPCLTTLNSATGNGVVLTLNTNNPTSSTASLTPIAPMPTVSAVGLYPRSSINTMQPNAPSNVDNQTQCGPTRMQPDSRFTVKPDPNDNIDYHSVEGPLDKVDTSSGGGLDPSAIAKSQGVTITDHEPILSLACEAPSISSVKSSIDEVIDAVLDGQFDENEYIEKIVKGTFDQGFAQSRLDFHSPSSSVTDPTSPSRMLEESNTSGLDKFPGVPVMSTNGAMSVPNSVQASDGTTMSSPSHMFTPMHVLTFVAANAATPQKITNISTASSCVPQTPKTSVLPTPTSLSQSTSISEPQHSISDPLLPAAFSAGANPITSGSLPVNGIEQLAAQFPSIPLTSYFYSLLARQQMNTSPNATVASTDPTSCKPTDNTLPVHVSTTLQTSLKGLNIPSTGDRADYLAAAAMAAMAAMASPTSVRSMTPLEAQVSTGSMMESTVYSHSGEGHPLPTHSLEIPMLQEYPVSWRGRLSLKNEEVHVQMHYLNGNQDLLKACLSVIAEQQSMTTNALSNTYEDGIEAAITQPLKIVQRMRLEPSQLEGVQRKLRQANDYCMCLTLAASPPGVPETSVSSEKARMDQVLCDGFIKYMVDKSAAGIINVCHPSTQQNLFVIHIFPPCDFSRSQLDGCTPTLLRQLTEFSTPHLLIVVTTV